MDGRTPALDEIKIWSVDGGKAETVQPTRSMASESLLEDTLVNNPDLLIPGLRLVGRQTPTEGGPLDLLGVDADGRLAIFELKRGTLSREAVAQVIDYASNLDSLDDDELSQHIADKSGKLGIDKIDNFPEWYIENVGREDLSALKPMRMFLVGLGVDQRTERIVSFLARNSAMDISLLVFQGFTLSDKTLLAKQVRVEGETSVGDHSKAPSRSSTERLELLTSKVQRLGVGDLFHQAIEVFRQRWQEPDENVHPDLHGLDFYPQIPIALKKPGRQPRYARVDPVDNGVRIVFYHVAIRACPDAFRRAIEIVPFETVPRARRQDPFTDLYTEIQFGLNDADWQIHKEVLVDLVRALYQALQSPNPEMLPDGLRIGNS